MEVAIRGGKHPAFLDLQHHCVVCICSAICTTTLPGVSSAGLLQPTGASAPRNHGWPTSRAQGCQAMSIRNATCNIV
eukprot:6076496-Amphidinium_carterae.1